MPFSEWFLFLWYKWPYILHHFQWHEWGKPTEYETNGLCERFNPQPEECAKYGFNYYRPHPKEWGKVMFSVCPRGGGVPIPPANVPYPPPPGPDGGTPRYLPPWLRYLPPPGPDEGGRRGTMGEGIPQGTYPPAKVPVGTPGQVPIRKGKGYPKVPTPQPRYLSLSPARSQWWEVYPKVPTPLTKLPTPSPGIGQQMEYLIRCGR